MFLVIGQGKT